jgi:hypothetical protein
MIATAATAQVDWTMLANLGVPLLILAAVGFAIWKAAVYIGRQLFGTQDKPGYLGQAVADFREFLESLVARLELIMAGQQTQQTMCNRHADLMETVSDSLAESSQSQKMSAAALHRLVEIHEKPGGHVAEATHEITQNKHDLQRVKKSIVHACEMCRTVAQREFPNSAEEVSRHCDEIEKAIGEA